MPAPDIRNVDYPIGPLRDKQVVAIGAADYVLETGFICEIATAGNLTYRTISGVADQVEMGLAVGDTINVGGIPVVLRAVRGASTVTSIVVGRL